MRNCFLVLFASASALFAQGAQVGVGVGLENSIINISGGSSNGQSTPLLNILPVNFTTVSLPILINGAAKIEPELGYTRFSTTEKSSGQNLEYSSSVLQLALSVSGGKRIDNILYLFGVKGGMTRNAGSNDNGTTTVETSQTNFFIGPMLGAEYFFHPNISLGAQAGFSFIFVGQPDETGAGSSSSSAPDVSEMVMGLGTKIALRWYY